jgi:hypothetical protein
VIKPHPQTGRMTTAEIREAITNTEEQLKLAKGIPDEQLIVWFSNKWGDLFCPGVKKEKPPGANRRLSKRKETDNMNRDPP